ncbi:bifunctional riboflavin kinase/FAD synthetase [Chloroflexota bacterium]
MSVERELSVYKPDSETVLTIGVFDGVHLGHQFLLSKLKEQALSKGLPCGVITFRQHPLEILCPGTHLPLITDAEEKASLLKYEDIDIVVTLNFTQQLASLTPIDFLGLLKKYLRVRYMVIGPDFAMGHGREGTIQKMHELGRKMGIDVEVVIPMKIRGEVTSSTAIRKALADGDMGKVRRMLGRYFRLRGPVVTGEKRGTGLGFPTANLEAESRQALPDGGIYATLVYINGEALHSVTNIGTRPTFDGKKRTVEIHILDFKGDIYGRYIRVDFIQRLRGEKCFESIEELKNQISEDIAQSRQIFDDIQKVTVRNKKKL